MHRDRYRGSGVNPCKFFYRKRIRNVIGAGAAILFGNENAHDAGVGEFRIEFARKDVFAIPLRNLRRDLTLRDLGGQRADRALLLR